MHEENAIWCNLKTKLGVGTQKSCAVNPISCPNFQARACRIFFILWKKKVAFAIMFRTLDSDLFRLLKYDTKAGEANVSFPYENGVGISKSLDLDMFDDSNCR